MRKITFKHLTTSSLGFGCSSLTKQFSRSKALNILDVAFECGVTHFDTARAYGFGMAESILGEFARNKRHQITITTKFGLESKKVFTKNLFLINTARLAVSTVGSLKNKMVNATSGVNIREVISVQNAEKSLHHSLRELGTDYVDFFLLHDCMITEANIEELVKFFERSIAEGKIRHVGLAGSDAKNADRKRLSQVYDVLQYHNVENLEPNSSAIPEIDRLHIHYNILSKMAGQPIMSVADFFKITAANNRKGICLFTSTNTNHIRANVKAWNEK